MTDEKTGSITSDMEKRHDSPARRKLKAWLQERGFTYKMLADYYGYSRGYVEQWMCGVSRPNEKTRHKLETMTGIHTREWMSAEDMEDYEKDKKRVNRLRRSHEVKELSTFEKMAGKI